MRRVVKVVAIAVVVILALAAAGLLALQPLARWETRRVLGNLNGMRGSFESVHVTLRDLSYEIHGLRLDKVGPNGRGEPFVRIPEARAGLYFKELVRGHVVASVDLLRPRITLVQSNEPAEKRTPQEAAGAAKRVQSLFPVRIDRLQVKGGEVVWIEAREPEKPVLRFHGIEATVENFASRPALARGEPTVVAGNGTLQSSGRVQFFATADPLAKSLTFAGQGSVTALELRDMAKLIESKSDVAPTKGTIDIFVKFVARDGALTGGVRPMLHDADLKAAKKGIGPKIKEWLGNLGLKMFKNQQTDTVAATIPIEGTVDGPQTQAVPTIMTVLRNAFVRGLQGGLGGLPPPKASKPEGVVEQARRALSPDRGQPRAQPQEGKKQ